MRKYNRDVMSYGFRKLRGDKDRRDEVKIYKRLTYGKKYVIIK